MPVTKTLYVPAGVEAVVVTVTIVLLSVEPAVRLTLAWFRDAVGPLTTTGETETDRLAVPVKPRLFSVIVDVCEAAVPSVKLNVVGEALMVKSGSTITTRGTECDSAPLVPIMENEYVPDGVEAVVETVSIDVGLGFAELRVTLDGANIRLRPVGVVPVNERLTAALSPNLSTWIVVVPELLAMNSRVPGNAQGSRQAALSWMTKSAVATTVRPIGWECFNGLLVPVRITVKLPTVPTAVATVRVVVADPPAARVKLVAPSVAVGPPRARPEVVRVTVPLYPLMLVMVIVDVSGLPPTMLNAAGLAAIVKSPGSTIVIATDRMTSLLTGIDTVAV
jgi:hypothetical protein